MRLMRLDRAGGFGLYRGARAIGGPKERRKPGGILPPRAILNPACHIDAVRGDGLDGFFDVVGIEAAGENDRMPKPTALHERPIERLAGAARLPFRKGVEQQVVNRKGNQAQDAQSVAHSHGFYYFRAGSARYLGAVHGTFVSVKLEHRKAALLGNRHDVIERFVYENAHHLTPSFEHGSDLHGGGELAPADTSRMHDHAHRPRPEFHREFGIFDVRNPADLDTHTTIIRIALTGLEPIERKDGTLLSRRGTPD